MPAVYEYACDRCEFKVESKYRVESLELEQALHDHSDCDGKLKRVYSLGGISFKGSGFYRNDK